MTPLIKRIIFSSVSSSRDRRNHTRERLSNPRKKATEAMTKLEKLTDNAAMKRVADKVAFNKEAGNIVDHAEEAQKARQDAVMQHVADKEDVYDRLNTGRGEGTTKTSRQDQVMQRINEKEALYRRLAGK